MSNRLEIFVDGACSGNPGPAAIGVVINQDDKRIQEISKEIGSATNNIAEYTALVFALQEALVLKADEVFVTTDSELMCKQVTGAYKVKDAKLKTLFDQVQQLIKGFRSFEIVHVPREQNKEADKLASQCLKKASQDGCPTV